MQFLKVITGFAVTLLAVLSLQTSVQAADEDNQAWQMIQDGALIVDVRTPAEFAEGHLADAINIPVDQIAQVFAERDIAKDTEVVLYCRSGNRSGKAQQTLIEQGYTHTFNGGALEELQRTAPAQQ